MRNPTGQELLRLARESRKLRLQGIRLLESHCKLGKLQPEKLPSNASQSINLILHINEKDGKAFIIAKLNLIVTYDGPEVSNPPITVGASFGIEYKIDKPFSQKTIEKALDHVAMMNVWPYWRELVHSMTIRMGLPPFPVPLYNVASLQKDDSK